MHDDTVIDMNAGGKARAPKPRTLLNIIITLIIGAVAYYFTLPAFNLHNLSMYIFIIFLLIVFMVLTVISAGLSHKEEKGGLHYLKTRCKAPLILFGVCVLFCIVGTVSSAVIFHTNAYSSLLKTETGDFTAEVSEISYDQIPMLDDTSANMLANRKLGELADLVSQFEVNGTSVQINYQNRPVRVSYLEYGNFFKWVNNVRSGIPAYMITDMVTQEVTVARLENGYKYSPSEYFFRNTARHLRFQYPTLMFSDVNFEIDENGNPYWVASVVHKTIGLFGGTDIAGAVLLNAVTGESAYYPVSEVPSWVDRVYTADLIIEQYDYYGLYHNGFFNSLFSQTGCTATTAGYNYIAQDDDVWMYTGITSIGGDESNIGFILVNQRTKQANYYSIAGAEEYSAMASAQGAVQQYRYTATFPLLLNVAGQPTYFMAMKDSGSLVKMYAMVNVQQYQIVATGNSLSECEANYVALLLRNNLPVSDTAQDNLTSGELPTENETSSVEPTPAEPAPTGDPFEISGVVAEIRTAVLDGTTYYYIRLNDGDTFYRVSAAESELSVILNVGDSVVISGYGSTDGSIVNANSVA